MHIANVVTCITAALILAACSGEPADRPRGDQGGAVKVVTQQVELRPMIDEIQALGTARAFESVDIQPRISSLIERIAFEEGQLVDAGELLIELENSEIVAGLALAEASLSESRSLYNRSKSLADTNAISASSLEQLMAQVQVNEAQVEAARARLDNTIIRAPFAGRVGLRRVSPGSFVNNSTVITTLDDVSRIKLDFSVPEAFLTAVSEGMNILATSLVYPDRVFKGVVASVDTRVDAISRAVQVRAIIPNDDGALKPGMFMTVGLQRDRGEVVMAPEQSIVPEGTQQFVFVVADGVAAKRAVQLGRRIPGFVAIDAGLDAGEAVITEGTHKVRDGTPVESIDQISTGVSDPADRSRGS
ncbi:MAG: efflux RND transporter periplasmic adaptor subunit [Gammaproteobacteria bacterium]|nr:efflux RND transporter periplasmic adaptor subunit [Gammaproteobacteria bacterium]